MTPEDFARIEAILGNHRGARLKVHLHFNLNPASDALRRHCGAGAF
jgi:hypothetical protein